MKKSSITPKRPSLKLGMVFLSVAAAIMGCFSAGAQAVVLLPGTGLSLMPVNASMPAPGSSDSFRQKLVGGFGNPGQEGSWGYAPLNGWENNWDGACQWMSQGTENVLASGYDARGVWRTIPLYVSYKYNGVNYSVTVLNAWNPWGCFWDRGVDMPAYDTSQFLNGTSYDFYVPLSTGTYYFNL